MGKVNNAITHYFKDKMRFANLFNGICFQGQEVIRPELLSDASETYESSTDSSVKRATGKRHPHPLRAERVRDIKMRLNTGETLRLLALENQDSVDYTMPFRCMQYDVMEYDKQLTDLRRKNIAEKNFDTSGEFLCKVKKSDRLYPVYTICMYHGEEPWDGPKTLKDMMDFGTDEDGMSQYFKDYPLFLYSIAEENDFSHFRGDVKILFDLLQYRKDKTGMQKLLQQSATYQHINEETLKVVSVMLNAPKIWENRKLYLSDAEQEEYDMCQALREWIEEERAEGMTEGFTLGKNEGFTLGKKEGFTMGKNEGIQQQITITIRNMLRLGMQDEDIRTITECGQEMIDIVRQGNNN